ncbi:P27 family phage terminase small subunit [Gemmata sp. G18]|uniref:P27 family phage terminase small subunit n=1 Tax=Gemmata palustris TaxID=2822762 RepID=A0ABS5BMG7_9BACT|nr:P27 family phage terminase small subunit [Gemmata palustris]MBP3954896.1 P27 family phage terminase small subunit [Gemmata palustris]
MRGGNNRIPPSEHLARGTYRANRHGQLPNDPISHPLLPADPPPGMRPDAVRVWNDLYPLVTGQGMVTLAERELFAMYCRAMGDYLEAREHVNKEGFFKKPKCGESGDGVQYSRWYRLMCDRETVAARLGAQIGLTPVDRHRVARAKVSDAVRKDVTNVKPMTTLDRLGQIRLLPKPS